MLGLLFAIIALFYASVGFGGGSSYLALLVLSKVDYLIIPAIALICNITVVSGNSFHYIRAGYVNWKLLLPPTLASLPMAYWGGRLTIEKELFILLLFFTLLATGLRMLCNYRNYTDDLTTYTPLKIGVSSIIGAILGLFSGMVGIGGGIFLAPILYHFRAGSPKHIATTASLFILANSIAGLIGQLQKNDITNAILQYWHLPLLVFIGGQIGNLLTLKFIPSRIIALLTSGLVLFVAGRLGLWLIL